MDQEMAAGSVEHGRDGSDCEGSVQAVRRAAHAGPGSERQAGQRIAELHRTSNKGDAAGWCARQMKTLRGTSMQFPRSLAVIVPLLFAGCNITDAPTPDPNR